jgi:cyclopropane-fatty-acyl-phospholipid synthase
MDSGGVGMIWTTSASRSCPDVADLLWPTLGRLFRGNLPVRLRAWDGSEIGPPDGPVLICDKHALRRLLWQPSELGLVRAYVAGELEVDGDLTECLRLILQAAREHGLTEGRFRLSRWAGAAVRLGLLGLPPEPPASEARIGVQANLGRRDQAAGTHIDDLRPDFCQLILGPQLASSAALWTPDSQNLADAQAAALDVLCARLRLKPGMRLLDVGCGWGALAIHAACNFGVHVTAVTRSANQAAFVERRAADLGLQSRLAVRAGDGTEISVPPQDAVAIETGEQIGDQEYAAWCERLRGQLRPGGRLVIRQMSLGVPEGRSALIDRYVAADLHLRPVSETVSLLERAGFEISDFAAMRRDYTRTVHAWQRNLERRWQDAVAMAGVESARVWRLCLAGVALACEDGRMGVHQVVAAARPARATRVRPAAPHIADAEQNGALAAGGQQRRTRLAGIRASGLDAADPNVADLDAAYLDAAGLDAAGLDAAGLDAAGLDAAGLDAACVLTAGFDAADIHAARAWTVAPAPSAHPAGARPAGAHAASTRPVGAAQLLLSELLPRQHRPNPRHAGQAQARSG